jgi:hypothetical protein
MVPNPQTQGCHPHGFAKIVAGGASDVLPKPPFPYPEMVTCEEEERV